MIENINITLQDILEIMGCPSMLEKEAFWKMSEDSADQLIHIPDYITFFHQVSSILKTNGLLIRGLEKRSEKFREYCKAVGAVDCNIIISPKGAPLFDYHVDPNDVAIKVLYGKRIYWINGKGSREAGPGDCLYIKQGEVHKVTVLEDSISVSFGIPFSSKKVMAPRMQGEDPFNFNELFSNLTIFKQWSQR